MKPQPCKLMRKDDTTGNETILQWGNEVNNRIFKQGHELCTDEVIHFYAHPLLAVFFCPIHVVYAAKLRQVTHHSKMVSDGTKCAAKSVTTGKRIPLPKITSEQRVEIAIRCALKVHHKPKFVKWANNWLNGIDRSSETAYAFRASTFYAPRAAYYAAHAAYDATNAAYYAALAVDVIYADYYVASVVNIIGTEFDLLGIIADVVGWKEE